MNKQLLTMKKRKQLNREGESRGTSLARSASAGWVGALLGALAYLAGV